jgi:hypothetical protein
MSGEIAEQRMPDGARGRVDESAVPLLGSGHMAAAMRPRVPSHMRDVRPLPDGMPRRAMVRAVEDDRRKRQPVAGRSPRAGARFGASVRKLIEISVASAIHALVWVVVVLWVETIYYSDMTRAQALMDAGTVFAMVWLSTFICFFVLVEKDDH